MRLLSEAIGKWERRRRQGRKQPSESDTVDIPFLAN